MVKQQKFNVWYWLAFFMWEVADPTREWDLETWFSIKSVYFNIVAHEKE